MRGLPLLVNARAKLARSAALDNKPKPALSENPTNRPFHCYGLRVYRHRELNVVEYGGHIIG